MLPPRLLFGRNGILRSFPMLSKSPYIARRLLASESGPAMMKPAVEMKQVKSPTSLTNEVALGVQDATRMYMRYGLGKQRLEALSVDSGDVKTLVPRWQKMMEAFLGTQVHVLAGLGYTTDENGLGLYNQHFASLMQNADPDMQEKLRVSSRDLWRETLTTAFNISMADIKAKEMSIVDARNTMHKVSQRMIEPVILETISQKSASLVSTANTPNDMAQKHQIVQDILVNMVYLGGDPSLVEECGFESGEKGYVFMQCIMAEHQNDPLIAQYIGNAMMQVLTSAGLDMTALNKPA